MGNEIKRRISIWINGKEVKNNLASVGKEIGKLKGQINKLTPGTEEFVKKSAELAKARKHYRGIKDEIDGQNISLREAKRNVENLLDGFLSGDINEVKAGLRGIKGSIQGITNAAWQFIKTPIGAALAVIAGIGFGVKKWIDFNLEVEKSNKLINELTQLTGNAMNAVRIRAEVLEKTFQISQKESVETAKSLVKSLGISYDEAFDIIEDGAIRGKHKNEEFLESLKEYPSQFANAGFSAKEFAAIVNTGIDMGVYKDKLPDAIKEADLALREQTQSTKDALTNAFGSAFSNEIQQKIRTGEYTTKQALQRIAAESEKVNLSQQQRAQLTADLFKGAGEDAGGALKIFEALNISLNETAKPLTELQEITKEQLETNKELKGVYTALFTSGNSGFSKLIAQGKLYGTKILLKILKGGVSVYNWLVDLNNESGIFSAILTGLAKSATFGFRVIGKLIEGAWNSFKGLGNIVAGIFTFDLDKIKQGFSQGVGELKNTINNIKDIAVNDVNEIYDAFKGGNKKRKIDLKTLVAEDVEEKEDPKKISLKDQAKIEAFKKGEQELDKLIADIRKKRELSRKTGLEKELAQIEDRYAKIREKYKGHSDKLAELEKLKQEEIDAAKLKKQQEYLEKAKALDEENYLKKKEAEFNRRIEEAASDEERAFIILERVRWIALKELEIEEEKELAKLEAVEGSEKLKTAIIQKYTLARQRVDDEYSKGKRKADEADHEREVNLTRARVSEYNQMFGNIRSLVGKNTIANKAAAVAQATMNTYQGVSEVWSTKSTLPEPFATLSRIANTAVVLGSGLRAVSAIKQTKTPTFFYGGYTGNKSIGKDKYGKLTGLVHENEYVAPAIIAQDPVYAPIFSFLENERVNKLKGYYYGGSTGKDKEVSNTEFTAESISSLPIGYLVQTLNNLNSILANGIGLNFGYQEAKKVKELEDDLDNSKTFGQID